MCCLLYVTHLHDMSASGFMGKHVKIVPFCKTLQGKKTLCLYVLYGAACVLSFNY